MTTLGPFRDTTLATVVTVEEARRVLERLERIERLDRSEAPAEELLAEVRALLTDAEAWARREGRDTDCTLDALERCRTALGAPVAATR